MLTASGNAVYQEGFLEEGTAELDSDHGRSRAEHLCNTSQGALKEAAQLAVQSLGGVRWSWAPGLALPLPSCGTRIGPFSLRHSAHSAST